MKKILILLTVLTSFAAKAQNRAADSKAIESQIDAMVNSWNKHNYSDMHTYVTADCDWVNIVGMWWKNAKEVQFAHQAYHNTMFKSTALSKKSVTIRFISTDAAVVHFISHVGKFTTPDGHQIPEGDDLAMLVYVKQNGKWLLTSGENLTIDPRAAKNDPVLHMPK